jgi:hypothetical protein
MKAIVVALLFVAYATADLYMQNPRGSNDRLNEANANRDNANRLFDSQNNAKGGYCWGPSMSFYEGSLLSVEWTNQHGCGINGKLVCNMIIQYMCSNTDADPTILVRDGASTETISDDANGAVSRDATTNELHYGMHEDWTYYTACKTRQRNMGLFIADREDEGGLDQGRASAIFTRQNNNGDRHGYECAEERDYYPYWAPTPWRDLSILASDEKFCDFYRKESQNVKGKGWCSDKNGKQVAENNEIACHQKDATYIWQKSKPWGIPAPECVQAPWSRDNHLGNGPAGFANGWNVTLPRSSWEKCIGSNNCNCVLRLRYNISTGDTGPNSNRPDKGFIDWTSNAGASPVKQDPILNTTGLPVQLAMNTNQFGRTFQDRSHVFHLIHRPHGVSGTEKIYNLNVRGKRGNIVETYPATEYDFVPERLFVTVGNYIHFQWTGCDTNPAGNAGEGTDGTDRSNVVQIEHFENSHPATDQWLAHHTPMFESKWLRQHMALLDQTGCLTYDQLLARNNNNENAAKQDKLNCMKLNAAPTGYFNGGLIKMNLTGTFYYMSSRNNNFSNRGQKATLIVQPLLPNWAVGIVVTGAVLFVGSAGVAGAMLYAKSHPHSSIANVFTKI